MIIDCHVHINQCELTQNVPLLEDRLEMLQTEMTVNNVDYAIILSSYKVNSERPSTGQIIEAIKKYDNLGVAAGFTIDNHTDEDLRVYRQWIKDGKIKAMKNIKMNIDFYSDVLEDDIVLELSVNYDLVEEGSVSSDGMYGREVDEVCVSAQFLDSDVTILNDVRHAVRVEFFDKFDDYEEEIKEAIEEEINE